MRPAYRPGCANIKRQCRRLDKAEPFWFLFRCVYHDVDKPSPYRPCGLILSWACSAPGGTYVILTLQGDLRCDDTNSLDSHSNPCDQNSYKYRDALIFMQLGFPLAQGIPPARFSSIF